ncbi:uncharacterized protein side-III isoform X2 [Drosophila suzukii]
MNVIYPPQVTLSLGSTLRPDDIKEGDDVYFECHIKSNPKEHRIMWSHDGQPVTQNVSWGIIISTRSLVLQRVGRVHSGFYACSAANDRGETQSAPVNLRIRYAPVCSSSTITVIGASLEEAVPIPCRVNSDPPEIDFEWTFSTSGEHFEVPSGHYATIQDPTMTTTSDVRRTVVESNETHFETYVETVSELIYTPKGERDYGTLACYGRNAIGKQSEPCVFQVVPAAKPGALRNCTLRPYVVTSASLNSSNQTTMHANQMLPTQYGRHESNYPHMEYVRERHNSTARNNVANKNMGARTSAGQVKSNNKQPGQLSPQQLQRLKKRTSFTPSQTLAAIERQRQRKQQQQKQQQHQAAQQQHQQAQQQHQATAGKSGGDSKPDGSPAKSPKQRVRRASQIPQRQQQHQLDAGAASITSQRKPAESNLSMSHVGKGSSNSSSSIRGSNINSNSNNGKLPAKYFNKRQKNMHKQQRQQQKGTNEHNSNIIHHYATSSSSSSSSPSSSSRRRKRLAANDILATVAAAATSASLSSSSATSLAATATAAVEIEQDVASSAGSSNIKRSRKSLTILDKQQKQQKLKQQQLLLPPNAPQISNQPVAAISGNNVKETAATSKQVAVAAGVKDKASSKEDSPDNNDNDDDDNDDDDDDEEDNDDAAEMDAETETNDDREEEEDHDDDAGLDEDVAQLPTDADYLADGPAPGDLEEYETVEEVDGQHMLSLEEQLDLESLEDNVEEEEAGDDDDMYNVSDDDFVASVALSTSDTTVPATAVQRTTEGPHMGDKATQATESAAEWQLPHFDYSRMEYSFSNGVVTQSLLGGSGAGGLAGSGHDGFAGGGTINFDNYDNIIYSTMELECMPGYDGGLQQQFFLEAYDSKTKKLRLNMSSTYVDVPVFRIDLSDLMPMDYFPDAHPALHLVVYSVNQKGRSEPIVLENVPINEADKRSDGRMGLSILPLAALLAGTLFTVGIAVLSVVVIAVRRRRGQGARNMCDDKDKHLGMDVTVTAPLETGAGHQRLVVAYTLKQGIEKQPDILSAQKSAPTGGDASSPLGNRPSGLFAGGGGGGAGGASGAPMTGNTGGHKTTDYDANAPHLNSPPSQSSTLKLESDPAAGLASARGGNAPPLLYDAMPTLSRYEQLGLSMASYSAGAAGTGGSSSTLSSAGSTVSSAMAANGAAGAGGYAAHLHHTLPHNMAPHPQRGHDPLNLADYLTTSSLIDYGLNKPPAAHMTLPKGMGLGLGMGVGVGGGVAGGMGMGPGAGLGLGSVMAAGTSLSPSQLNTITHKSAAGRNHIITDTLPGPESCV